MKKLFAAAAILMLSACGGSDTKPEATAPEQAQQSAELDALTSDYTDILNEAFVLEGATETTGEAVSALLPDWLTLTIGSSEFDAASGATIWKTVSLTSADNDQLGITAEEVKLWGLNTDGIAARVVGTNLNETVKLAERIEARGVETLGLETAFTEFMIGYAEGVSSTIEAVAPEDGISDEELAEMRDAMEMIVDEYTFEVGQIVAVGPQMRPWEISRVDPAVAEAEPDKAALMVLQEFAAYYRTFGVDYLIWTDTRFSMAMDQDGIKQDVEGVYDLTGYAGWYGGDIESSIVTGGRFAQDMDMTEFMIDEGLSADEIPASMQSMRMDFGLKSGTFKEMKFDKVLRYIAMGEWPPTTDTELMSYGRLDTQGIYMSLNEADLISIDSMVLDLSDWHWFIPSKVEMSFEGMRYDISGIMDLMASAPDAPSSEELEMVNKVMDVAKKYDALPIIFDAKYAYEWNPETGAFTFTAPQKHHNFGQAEFEVSGFLPNFEDGVAAVKADMAYEPDPDADFWETRYRETAWDKLIQEKLALTGGLLVLDDQGGLDKIFPLMSEIGKLNPDEAGPMLANSDPEALRSAASSSIGFAAIQAGKELPPAEAWVMAFSDWVRDGGTVRLTLEPSEPLGAHLAEKYPDPSPSEIAEILGISVSHEKPQP